MNKLIVVSRSVSEMGNLPFMLGLGQNQVHLVTNLNDLNSIKLHNHIGGICTFYGMYFSDMDKIKLELSLRKYIRLSFSRGYCKELDILANELKALKDKFCDAQPSVMISKIYYEKVYELFESSGIHKDNLYDFDIVPVTNGVKFCIVPKSDNMACLMGLLRKYMIKTK